MLTFHATEQINEVSRTTTTRTTTTQVIKRDVLHDIKEIVCLKLK